MSLSIKNTSASLERPSVTKPRFCMTKKPKRSYTRAAFKGAGIFQTSGVSSPHLSLHSSPIFESQASLYHLLDQGPKTISGCTYGEYSLIFLCPSVPMKLPLSLWLFCLRPMKLFPPVRFVYVLLFDSEAAPPTQNMTMARKRHATAAHMKAKLYLPSDAVRPEERKLLRPMTKAALWDVSSRTV
jgi:hypothetical protein